MRPFHVRACFSVCDLHKEPSFCSFFIERIEAFNKSCSSHVDSCETKTKMLKVSGAEIVVSRLGHLIKPEGIRG